MTDTAVRSDLRSVIVEAAARLLGEGGTGAVTTRGVAEAAGVQAPAIYRLFGDKDGLLDAVAEHVMATYVSAKADLVADASARNVDPVDELRAGWTTQIEFGLANPAVFRLASDPDRVLDSPAAAAGRRVLETRIRRIAAAGRLRVSETRAVELVQAAGVGTIQTLLATPPERRDPALADAMLDAVLTQIVTRRPKRAERGPVGAAVALRSAADQLDMLTGAERQLFGEWLDRVIAGLSERDRVPGPTVR